MPTYPHPYPGRPACCAARCAAPCAPGRRGCHGDAMREASFAWRCSIRSATASSNYSRNTIRIGAHQVRQIRRIIGKVCAATGTARTAHCFAFWTKYLEMLRQIRVRHMYGTYGKYYAFWTKSLSPARMRERVLSKTHVICRNLPYYSGLVNLISNLKVRQIDVMCRTD